MSIVPLPVAQLIPLLSTGSITVRRRGQPVKNAIGELAPGPYVDIVHAESVVHPASAAVLAQHPIANLAAEHIEAYTLSALRTAQGSASPDQILYQSNWYKVVAVSDYGTQGLCWFALAERMVRP